MTELTHVLFDFFGTLVSYSESRIEQGYPRSHALLLASGASLDYAEFLGRWDRIFEAHEVRAQRSLDEYSMDAVCRELLSQVLPRPPDTDTIAALRDTYLSEWSKGVVYLPEVPALLSALAERFVLVLVSNTHHAGLVHDHLRAMNVARCFSGVVTSVEHGKRKPSPGMFEHAFARFGGGPTSSIYVGDSFSSDYQGAANAGLRCLLIDPTRRHAIPETDRLRDILELRARLAAVDARAEPVPG